MSEIDYSKIVPDPKPGTNSASKQGCPCPVIDNHYGKGCYGDGKKEGWVITEGCHLHDIPKKPKQETAEEREDRFRKWLFK